MTDEKTVYKLPSEFILKITGGPGSGAMVPLFCMNEYTIGRADDCSINIDDDDSKASRKHAVLKVGSDDLVLEDLGSGNGTFVNGEKIQSSSLKKGDTFQIGITVFLVESFSAGKKASKEETVSSAPAKIPYKTAGIVGTVIICLILAAVLFMGPDDGMQGDVTEKRVKEPVATETKAGKYLFLDQPAMKDDAADDFFAGQLGEKGLTAEPVKQAEKALVNLDVSDLDRKQADLYFKQGMLLYDNGELKKAIDKWYSALDLNPADSIIKKRLIKTEEELGKDIDRRYQNALLHKKYMRYSEAEEEFRIVTELIRHKDDEWYINSMKQIKELRKK